MGPKQRKNASKKQENKTDEKGDVGVELEKALEALERNRRAMLTLYVQWRQQLLRMSTIVMLVVLYQLHEPTTSCVKEIKELNEIRTNSMEEAVAGWQAAIMVLNDSIVELLSLICGLCLILCLNKPINYRDFETASFRTSCICIPLIVFQYHGSKQNLGCLDDTMMQHVKGTADEAPVKRGFPVILVFHTVTTLALYFMQYQARKMDENVRIMLKLKEELTEARKGK